MLPGVLRELAVLPGVLSRFAVLPGVLRELAVLSGVLSRLAVVPGGLRELAVLHSTQQDSVKLTVTARHALLALTR